MDYASGSILTAENSKEEAVSTSTSTSAFAGIEQVNKVARNGMKQALEARGQGEGGAGRLVACKHSYSPVPYLILPPPSRLAYPRVAVSPPYHQVLHLLHT